MTLMLTIKGGSPGCVSEFELNLALTVSPSAKQLKIQSKAGSNVGF